MHGSFYGQLIEHAARWLGEPTYAEIWIVPGLMVLAFIGLLLLIWPPPARVFYLGDDPALLDADEGVPSAIVAQRELQRQVDERTHRATVVQIDQERRRRAELLNAATAGRRVH